MGGGRMRVATGVTGVMTLIALTGMLATCGGPAAYAGLKVHRARIVILAEVRIGNPEARFVRLPILVAAEEPGSEIVGAEVVLAGPVVGGRGQRAGLGEVVGRSLARRHLAEISEGGLLADSRRLDLGVHQAVVYVPVDMRTLGLADGESARLQVRATVARSAANSAGSVSGAGAASATATEGPGGTELDTLIAEATITVSALPSPSGDWYPGDAHFHTSVSDGSLPLPVTIAEAKNTYGMKWLVITDHWSSGGGGGVSKFPATGGAPAGFPSYYDAVMRYGVQNGLPIGPACEWSSAKNAIPGSGSHVLGMGMSRAANWTFPAMWSESRQTLVNRLNAHNPDAFTVAAHPVGAQANGFYDWDWKVSGNDCVELFTDMHAFHETIRTNWFARLRSELATVIASGPAGNFTVGVASSDGHANGVTAVAGGASMTWLWLPSGERTLPSPDNVKAVWRRIRLGNCVASGQGDFARGTFSATSGGTTATVGPGELVKSSAGSSVGLTVAYNARTGRRLKSIDVWRGNADGIVKSGTYAVDTVSGAKSIALTGPVKDCFYVVVAHFYDPASLNTTPRDVVCNPVWVDVTG